MIQKESEKWTLSFCKIFTRKPPLIIALVKKANSVICDYTHPLSSSFKLPPSKHCSCPPLLTNNRFICSSSYKSIKCLKWASRPAGLVRPWYSVLVLVRVGRMYWCLLSDEPCLPFVSYIWCLLAKCLGTMIVLQTKLSYGDKNLLLLIAARENREGMFITVFC